MGYRSVAWEARLGMAPGVKPSQNLRDVLVRRLSPVGTSSSFLASIPCFLHTTQHVMAMLVGIEERLARWYGKHLEMYR